MKAPIETFTRKRYGNPELEALLKSEHQKLLAGITLHGEELGRKNRPGLANDTLGLYIETFLQGYQALIDRTNSELQFQVACFEVVESDRLSDNKAREIEMKISDDKRLLSSIRAEIENTPAPRNRHYPMLLRICIAVIASLDALMNFQFFEMFGYSYIETIGIGICFAGVLVILSHLATRIVALGRTVIQRRLIAGSIFLVLVSVFGIMGSLRSDYLNGRVPGMRYTPYPFLILSFFFFATAIFANHFLKLSTSEKQAIRRFRNLQMQRGAIEDSIVDREAKLASVLGEKSRFRIENSSIVLYGNLLERQLITWAKLSCSAFINENIRFRTDGVPNYFGQEFSFQFTRYFDSID